MSLKAFVIVLAVAAAIAGAALAAHGHGAAPVRHALHAIVH